MARAVGLLARREHSKIELERKLAPHASDAEEVQQVMQRLQQQGLLSEERFVASLVRRRAAAKGNAVIFHELRQHGVSADVMEAVQQELRTSEYDRALAAWQKRFGSPPADKREQARQMRFLAARGFSGDIVRKLVPACVAVSNEAEPDLFDNF